MSEYAKRYAELEEKAKLADKIIRLLVKHGLVEPLATPDAPKRRGRPPGTPNKPRDPDAPKRLRGAAEPMPSAPRIDDVLRECATCKLPIPVDAYDLHVENCQEAQGRAHQE